MHGKQHGPRFLHYRDRLRELGEHLRQEHVNLIEVCYQRHQLIG